MQEIDRASHRDERVVPQRIQRRRSRDWKLPPNTVIVSRPSEWGNPFRVGKATEISPEKGKITWHVWSESSMWSFPAHETAQEAAVKLFRHHVVEGPRGERYRDRARLALRGKNLACWCRADHPCHADVLLELANGDYAEDARPSKQRGEVRNPREPGQ